MLVHTVTTGPWYSDRELEGQGQYNWVKIKMAVFTVVQYQQDNGEGAGLGTSNTRGVLSCTK